MSRRRTPLLCAAALGAALVTLQVPGANGSTSPPDLTPVTSDSEVVSLGGGERVQVTPVGGGRQTITPLPGPDGAPPGVVVSTDESGTTVASTAGSAQPVVVDGRAPVQAKVADDDLVQIHFAAIARDGRDASADVTIYDVETGTTQAVRRLGEGAGTECSTRPLVDSDCVLVPPGTYSVMAFVNTTPAHLPGTDRGRTVQNVSLVGQPEVEIDESQTFTLDARRARPVEVATPGRRTKVNEGGALWLGYSRTAANGAKIVRHVHPAETLDEQFFMQPTAPVRSGELQTLTRLRLEAPDIELSVRGRDLHPAYFDKVWFSDVMSDFPMFDGRDRLRVVDAGRATRNDLRGLRLRNAIAVVERSDDLSVAEQSNAAAEAGAALVVVTNDGPGDNGDPGGKGVKLQVPTVRLDRAEGASLRRAHGRVEVRGETASPYLYDLVLKEEGRIPRDLRRRVDRRHLAVQLRQVHGQPTREATFTETAYPFQPEETSSLSWAFPMQGGPRTRTEYRLVDPDTRWSYAVTTPESTYNALFPHPKVLRMALHTIDQVAYSRRGTTTMPVGAAPVVAAPNAHRPMERAGDRMRVAIQGFADADGNQGSSNTSDSGMSTLLQVRADGELVAETTSLPSGVAVLPPGDSTVEVSFVADNPQPWAELSTHTETLWTFASSTVPDGTVETMPVIEADYDVDLDLRNRMHGRRSFDLSLGHVAGSSTARITTVRVEASYDDGATWRSASVRHRHDGRWRISLPKGSGHVSLRLHAADASGSSLDQTVTRAWYVVR